jgi:hypothetical protein
MYIWGKCWFCIFYGRQNDENHKKHYLIFGLIILILSIELKLTNVQNVILFFLIKRLLLLLLIIIKSNYYWTWHTHTPPFPKESDPNKKGTKKKPPPSTSPKVNLRIEPKAPLTAPKVTLFFQLFHKK